MVVRTLDIGTLIVHTSDVRGGRPCIAGTGVTVQRIVGWYKLGYSPEEIVEEVGHLTLAQVHAALAYYHVNREEIESAIAADETEADRLAWQHGQPVGGRVCMQQQRFSVGEQMRRLLSLVANKSADEMKNCVEFLSAWGRRAVG